MHILELHRERAGGWRGYNFPDQWPLAIEMSEVLYSCRVSPKGEIHMSESGV